MFMDKKIKLEELHKAALDILNKARKTQPETATIVTLSGDLGAGKTTLTQEIAKTLGVKETINSPTFVIMKKYVLPLLRGSAQRARGSYNSFKNLIHIDAYRLNSQEDLLKIGWQEMFLNKENLIIIEWPENIAGLIGEHGVKVKLEHIDEDTRHIAFER